jgi:hypothetical protein
MKIKLAGAFGVLAVALALVALSGSAHGVSTVSAQEADACGNPVIDVPDSGPTFDFTDACAEHDECYGGGGSEADRRACDEQFLMNMQVSCNEMWPGQLRKRFSCYSIALTYFLGVRLGGWAFFDYGEEER